MVPNATDKSMQRNVSDTSKIPRLKAPQANDWKFQISYITAGIFGYLHLSAVYGLYLCFTSARWATIALGLVLLEAGTLGVLAGAHRLWSHRSYKATLPLQTILILLQSIAGQYTAFNWAKDHRLHHRYSDTDADPHNATRGFFFSHVGWLLVKKHPEIKRRAASIDLSDLTSNPVLMFQKRYGFFIITIFAYILPTLCPMYFWEETFINAYHVNILRTIVCLNFVSLINSASHTFGNRPYDKEVRATENMAVTIATLGEGFHNYHHVFPWDYRAAELISGFNITAMFIELFAWIGWAYDLKTVQNGVVVKRAMKCGDGTYKQPAIKSETVSNKE